MEAPEATAEGGEGAAFFTRWMSEGEGGGAQVDPQPSTLNPQPSNLNEALEELEEDEG